ncbi:MAG: VOC family protein [Alphaproteobacteria bacterium]|nr:VOC family protein [Alphaproteobacteria bacterium]
MPADVKPIPDGFHSVTPHLVVAGASDAIAWYRRAFGAEEIGRMSMPGDDERLMHAMIRIGDSLIMLVDEIPEFGAKGPKSLGGSSVTINLYVEDADAVFERAVAEGAEATMPVENMFWGDRYGRLIDPFGHSWAVATHVRDVPPDEMEQAAAQAFSQ